MLTFISDCWQKNPPNRTQQTIWPYRVPSAQGVEHTPFRLIDFHGFSMFILWVRCFEWKHLLSWGFSTEFQPFQPPGPGFDDHPFMTGKLLLLILVCMAPAAWRIVASWHAQGLGPWTFVVGLPSPSEVFLAACSSGHQFYSCLRDLGGVQFHQFVWVIKCYKTI